MVKKIKVIHYSWETLAYVGPLLSSLDGLGVDAISAPKWSRKGSIRIALGPIQLFWLRARGFQVINFHFIQEMFRPLYVDTIWWRAIFYMWYKLFLRTAKLLGFKLV